MICVALLCSGAFVVVCLMCLLCDEMLCRVLRCCVLMVSLMRLCCCVVVCMLLRCVSVFCVVFIGVALLWYDMFVVRCRDVFVLHSIDGFVVLMVLRGLSCYNLLRVDVIVSVCPVMLCYVMLGHDVFCFVCCAELVLLLFCLFFVDVI